MKSYLVKILLLLCQTAIAQDNYPLKWQVPTHDRISVDGVMYTVLLRIDTIHGDTAKYYLGLNKYTVVSKDGVLLVDGHTLGGMGSTCGCEALPHGYWIVRYRDGTLKEQGWYHCNQRAGTWVYYHKNGQVAKIERWKRPDLSNSISATPRERYSRPSFLLDGPYLEYYPNGQLKVYGMYKIVEQHTKTDTLFVFNPETFEEIPEIVEGDFWFLRTVQYGYWTEYSLKGELLSQKYYNIYNRKDEKFRHIETSY